MGKMLPGIISTFIAAASEWMRYGTETGGEVIVELKSQCRPSQSRKESILNCLLKGKRCFIYTKVKEGSDQEISDLSEKEGK